MSKKTFLSRSSGKDSIFFFGEDAEIHFNAVVFYSCAPLFSIFQPSNTSKSSYVFGARWLVFSILFYGGSAKVIPVIFGAFAVFMVDDMGRPGASHIEPREAMPAKSLSVNLDLNVRILSCFDGSCNGANSHSVGGGHNPSKQPRLGIVVKDFAQSLRGKIGLSHDALQLLIGQRPAGVDSTARASSF